MSPPAPTAGVFDLEPSWDAISPLGTSVSRSGLFLAAHLEISYSRASVVSQGLGASLSCSRTRLMKAIKSRSWGASNESEQLETLQVWFVPDSSRLVVVQGTSRTADAGNCNAVLCT